MNTSDHVKQFSFTRFRLVLKRYLVLNQRTWLTGILSVAGFLLLIAFFPYISNMSNLSRTGFESIQETAVFFYVLGGLILTSMIFNEINTTTRAFQFLTLPSTTLEKISAAWITGTVVYSVTALASIFLLSIFIEAVQGINTGNWTPFTLFNPFSPEILNTILLYFFYQSVFLLGAVYFKKNNFLKTLLVIIIVGLGFFFFLNIAILIFGLSHGQEFSLDIQLGSQQWVSFLKYLIPTGLTLFFLWLSYLQLKNKQVA